MSEFYELTNDYYLNCTSNCASELAEIRETLINLDSEYSSKDEEIEKLNERDKKIMILRYGLFGNDEITQKDVADMLGISQSIEENTKIKKDDKLKIELKSKLK